MDPSEQSARRRRVDGAVPLGLALIALGVIFTLDAMEVLDARELLAGWWPVAIVAAGAWWALTGTTTAGLLAVLVGVLLLATTHDLVDVPVGSLVLPGLLLFVGGALLQAGARLRAARLEVPAGPPGSGVTGATQSATAVFGDARLPVSPAGDGADRVVVATSVFGDVRVTVPDGWRVEDRVTRILGEVKVPAPLRGPSDGPVAELHGLALFGDVRVERADHGKGGR